jgi:hypothetical protein
MSRTDPAKGAADFLRRVVPWPVAGAQGVINLHWTLPDGKGGMPGKPFADLASLLSYIPWASQHSKWIKDIYFCLSLQAETGLTKTGKVKAARHANAALALKALWADVDGYKDYPSKTDALAAIHAIVCHSASLSLDRWPGDASVCLKARDETRAFVCRAVRPD